jgi:hypothetical protein
MRPNTPHMVVTTDHAICYGTHFVSSATIRQTCYSIFHTFIARSEVTNAENLCVWTILHRFLGHYHQVYLHQFFDDRNLELDHVPDLSDPEDLIDFFTFLATVELSLALHPHTYRPDASNAHWAQAQRAKVHTRRILQWFHAHFAIFQAGYPIDLYFSLLVQFCMSFVSYLAHARAKGLTHSHYDMDRLLYEVQEVIAAHPETKPLMDHRQDYIKDTFEYTEPLTVNTQKNPGWSLDELPNVPTDISPSPSHVKPRMSLSDFLGGEGSPAFPYELETTATTATHVRKKRRVQ